MSSIRTTLSGAAVALLVVAAFHAGTTAGPAPTQPQLGSQISPPLPDSGPDSAAATISDREATRDNRTTDVSPNAVPGLGSAELLYVPLTPCRVVDSRSGTGNYGTKLGDGSGRTYYIAGTSGFPTQGGKSGGCGVPTSAMAVTATVLAYKPSSDGAIKTWAASTTERGLVGATGHRSVLGHLGP